MESPLIGIAYDSQTNKKKLTILDKGDQKGFYIHSIDIEGLKERIDSLFDHNFEFIKEEYLKEELIQKINISLDEYYKIIKAELAILSINKYTFNKVESIYIPDSKGIYFIYKEIFNGNLDLETFRKALLEMLVFRFYRFAIWSSIIDNEEDKLYINNTQHENKN